MAETKDQVRQEEEDFRVASGADVATFSECLRVARAESWVPCVHDFECAHAGDPDGFLVGFRRGGGKEQQQEEEEEAVAFLYALVYNPAFAFVSYYLMDEAHRGKGWGWRLWCAMMERLALQAVSVVSLDAVDSKRSTYESGGFTVDFAMEKVQGVVAAAVESSSPGDDPAAWRVGVVSQEEGMEAALVVDQRVTGGVRRPEGFVREFFFGEGRVAVLARGAQGQEEGCLGMVVARRCLWSDEYRLGPLYVEGGPAMGRALLREVQREVGELVTLSLNVPSHNEEARRVLLEEMGFKETGNRNWRMHKELPGGQEPCSPPVVPVPQVWGITSCDVG